MNFVLPQAYQNLDAPVALFLKQEFARDLGHGPRKPIGTRMSSCTFLSGC